MINSYNKMNNENDNGKNSSEEKEVIQQFEKINLNSSENKEYELQPNSYYNNSTLNFSLNMDLTPCEYFPPSQNILNSVMNSTVQQNLEFNPFISSNFISPGGFNMNLGDLKNKTLKKIDQGIDQTLPVVSVIVTMYSGSSYDDLFRSVKQVAPEGRVALYSASLDSIEVLLKILKGELSSESTDAELKKTSEELLSNIKNIEPDCVLFNWECCSGCDSSFPQKEKTMELLKLVLDKQYMTMFSDFALKSLIKDWDPELLGPNPFKKVGECNSKIILKFKPESLKECPSSQLKMVGQLCEKGEAVLHALPQTIVFTVDKNKVDPARYQLEVLTIVTKAMGFEFGHNSNLYEINGEKGTVGHALIKFNNGGIILVSAGHWIELSKLDVNVTELEKVAEMYGGAYSQQINSIKNSSKSEMEKSAEYNFMAKNFVQQCAPCNYSQSVQKK